MPRAKFQTLTEQMFYILLCLRTERCGIDIMDMVPELTRGHVTVGSGTLYKMTPYLSEFQSEGLIEPTRVEGRRRSYILTDRGRRLLAREYEHICRRAEDYRRIMEEESI